MAGNSFAGLMRHRLRGLFAAAAPAACAAILCSASMPALAAFNNTTPRATFAGVHNYVATGGTLRRYPNDTNDGNTNECQLVASGSSSATLPTIPSGSTILKAYLYWGGSGSSPDYNITFDGPTTSPTNLTALPADRLTEDYDDGTNLKHFFGGVYDVTSMVPATGGTFTFSNLSVDNTDPYCSGQNVLAAWSLVVVYSNVEPVERYRYTRIYDGLQLFRGSAVTTTQSGFRVPDLVDGKVTVITWEGDVTSSGTYQGVTEALQFDGNALLNAGCDVTDNMYNSTIGTPTSCNTTAYGLDVDSFDVTPYLYEGQSSATLYYSSGNDAVFLAAQIISTTNTPVADLSISKVHNGTSFTAGQNGSYDIAVHNLGPEIATGTATVTDTLPTGLTFVSNSGTGWTCGAVGQTVTCNNSQNTINPCIPPMVPDASCALPTLTLTVAVDGTAAASTQNTATVSHPMFDGTGGNSTSTDTVAVKRSNLSTSTKSVVDKNGGSIVPGDVLEYTIAITNSGDAGIDATGVSVLDDLAANLGSLAIVSIPAGASDSSIGSGGANGTGQVNVTGITVPAATTVYIKFDATIAADAGPGDTIDNSATITNPGGPGATPAAPRQTVPDPAPPTSGNKRLYLLTGNTQGVAHDLTRVIPTGNGAITWRSNDGYQYFYLPALVKPLVLDDDTVTVSLRARRSGNSATRRLRARFYLNGTNTGSSISGNTSSLDANIANYADLQDTVDLDTTSFAIGDQLILRVEDRDNSYVQLTQLDGTSYSYVELDAQTVINVDDVSFYSAAYPATTTKSTWEAGDTVYIRATISDPFGEADITSATLGLKDGAGSTVTATGWAVKTETPSNDPAVKVYEASYTIPTSPAPNYGTFTATVNAKEGLENTISHTRANTFTVVPKALTVAKSHSGDFSAGGNNSYTLLVNNSGTAISSGTTTTVKDTLATGLTFVSGTGTDWSCSAAGQVVTCTSTAAIPASGSMAPITLTVAVAGNMGTSVANQASVGNSSIAGGYQKPGNTDTAIVGHADLSTSTKSVLDTNGGDANPGDTLRYTIAVKNTATSAASNVTVTDTLPFGLTGLTGVNATLTTCSGTPSVVGSTLTVTGLALSGMTNCNIVFDVQVSGSAGTGLVIDNTATIANPAGEGATPDAQITVSQSQVAASGNKILYVYANDTMTRVAQAASGQNTTTSGVSNYHDFVLPAVSGALTITPSSTISISLWLARTGSTTTQQRYVYFKLFKRTGVTDTQIGAPSGTVNFSSTTLAKQNFTITAPAFGSAGNLVPGDKLVLRLYNDSDSGGNDRSVLFEQYNGSGSTVTITTPTVVHVDSVNVYSAAYPATTQASSYGQGATLYVRASVTDPFGFADISGGSITIKNPSGGTVQTDPLVNGTHTVGTPAGATRVYEYAYTVPPGAPAGSWTASVTAKEGSENTITHTGNGSFNVGGKVTLRKTWGAGATAGNAVSLAITGGTGAVAGSSTAPSTLTPATANGAAGATITLAEAYTNGLAGDYTTVLACVKDSDSTTVTVSGTGLSRTITMPVDSVTCTWTNSRTVPLTVVKVSTVVSDPVNGITNPKAIPGAIVEYQIILSNPAANPVDADTVFVADQTPAHVDLRVADIGASGSGPVSFTQGSPASGLTYAFSSLSSTTDDVAFSNDNGATWTYVPTPDADGVDAAVTNIRINPKGVFNANNAQFTLRLRVRIE